MILFIWISPIHSKPIFNYQSSSHPASIDLLYESSNIDGISPTISQIIIPGSSKDIETMIHTFYGSRDITVSSLSLDSALWIKGPEKTLEEIKVLIHKIPTKSKQVLYRFHVFEFNHHHDKQNGLHMENLSAGINWQMASNQPVILTPEKILGTIKHLESNQHAEMRAYPSLLVDNHATGTLKVGDTIPYINSELNNQQIVRNVRLFETGLWLEVSPTLMAHNFVRTRLKFRLSNVKAWHQFNYDRYPIMSNRETETEYILKDGEGLILGGLIDHSIKENNVFVPFLSHIPLIGDWFKWTVTERISRDLIIMVRVFVV